LTHKEWVREEKVMKSASPEECLKKLDLPPEYDYAAEIERKKQGIILSF